MDLNVVEKVIDARYLSLVEREEIHGLRRAGLSIGAIVGELGRAPSTISRELARNTVTSRGYMPTARTGCPPPGAADPVERNWSLTQSFATLCRRACLSDGRRDRSAVGS